MSLVAVPLVDVAAWSLRGRNGVALLAAVASGRNEAVNDVVSIGWQRDTNDARRTVGNFDATVAARNATDGTALTGWDRRILTVGYGTLDRVTYQSVSSGAVQSPWQTLAADTR